MDAGLPRGAAAGTSVKWTLPARPERAQLGEGSGSARVDERVRTATPLFVMSSAIWLGHDTATNVIADFRLHRIAGRNCTLRGSGVGPDVGASSLGACLLLVGGAGLCTDGIPSGCSNTIWSRGSRRPPSLRSWVLVGGRSTTGSGRASSIRELSGASDARCAAPRPTKLERYQPLIAERLTTYPELSAVRLLEECRAADYAGGYSQLKAFVARIGLGWARPATLIARA